MSDGTIDHEILKTEIRKFLKKVGITSQQEIEQAVTAADADGCLKDHAGVRARITLELPDLGVRHVIAQDLALR